MTDKRIDFVTELSDGTLVFFPAGVGRSTGYDLARATPIAHPRWRLTAHHENRTWTYIPVYDDRIRLKLLELPRCRHA